jgi:hypothetical protein
MTAVVSARRGVSAAGKQHVGGPARAATGPLRPQHQHGVAVVAHDAGAGVTPRAQRTGAPWAGERGGGQGGLGLAGVGDPDHRGMVGHGARAWSSSTAGGRGQLVWQPIRPVGPTGRPRRHRPGSAR